MYDHVPGRSPSPAPSESVRGSPDAPPPSAVTVRARRSATVTAFGRRHLLLAVKGAPARKQAPTRGQPARARGGGLAAAAPPRLSPPPPRFRHGERVNTCRPAGLPACLRPSVCPYLRPSVPRPFLHSSVRPSVRCPPPPPFTLEGKGGKGGKEAPSRKGGRPRSLLRG